MEDQAKYVFHLFWQTHAMLKELLSKQYPATEDLVTSLLTWVARTLDSSDAFLLSWPDEKGLMQVQEPAVINTPALRKRKTIRCFKGLCEWLDNDEDHWSRGDTSDMPELQNAHIESFIMTKMFTREKEGFLSLLSTPILAQGNTKPSPEPIAIAH